MNIEAKKIIIAKYLGLITADQGHWYYENTGSLKYDDDWNWIVEAYNQITAMEEAKGPDERLNPKTIALGIVTGDKSTAFDAIYEFIKSKSDYNILFELTDSLPFGRYRGMSIADVLVKDQQYIHWIYELDVLHLSEEVVKKLNIDQISDSLCPDFSDLFDDSFF